jgi:hypothetical protein
MKAILPTAIAFILFTCVATQTSTCQSTPSSCNSCSTCLTVARLSDGNQAYYWVNDEDTSSPGTGSCVQRYDPTGSDSLIDVGSSALCGKRVFLDCTGGRTISRVKSCSSSSPSPSPSPPSSGTTCTADPSICISCSSCLNVVRLKDSKKAYYWVNDNGGIYPDAGKCVQRYDPVGSNLERSVDIPELCEKTVFLECTGGSVSYSKSTCTGASLKLSFSLIAGLVALLALFVDSI